MVIGFMFIFGCCMGSFIQVIMERFLTKESWIMGRSHCISCHQRLKFYMMVPILSWIVLRGKCSYCKAVIPFRYVIIELLFGILAFVCFYYEREIGILQYLMICILFLIAYFDLKTMMIEFIWIFLLLVNVTVQLMVRGDILMMVGGSISVSGIMVILNILIPESFGQGDIQLMAICGALLGMEKIFESWLIGNIFAGIHALFLLIKKKANRKSHIPYAPALCSGIVFVLMKNMLSL